NPCHEHTPLPTETCTTWMEPERVLWQHPLDYTYQQKYLQAEAGNLPQGSDSSCKEAKPQAAGHSSSKGQHSQQVSSTVVLLPKNISTVLEQVRSSNASPPHHHHLNHTSNSYYAPHHFLWWLTPFGRICGGGGAESHEYETRRPEHPAHRAIAVRDDPPAVLRQPAQVVHPRHTLRLLHEYLRADGPVLLHRQEAPGG
ncbi:MAG: hypothetical protein SGPRY_001994, partial [Prymnesium sp.]